MARRTSLSEAFAPPAPPKPVPEAAAPGPAPAAHRQPRMSAQALLDEVVNDLFQKHGKPGIV